MPKPKFNSRSEKAENLIRKQDEAEKKKIANANCETRTFQLPELAEVSLTNDDYIKIRGEEDKKPQ